MKKRYGQEPLASVSVQARHMLLAASQRLWRMLLANAMDKPINVYFNGKLVVPLSL